MMNLEKIVLSAKKREETGKKMRAATQKNIPAVIYGRDFDSQNLWIDSVAFAKVFAQAGTNTVISLSIEGEKKELNVLIYEYQVDAITNDFTHVDLYLVDMKQEVEAEIPLNFVGVSAAVKELGGTLVKSYDAVLVKSLPGDLPQEIEVDLTKLATFEDNITVADISVGDEVELMVEMDAVIASVIEPRSEEEIAALDDDVDADVSKIEGVADKEDEEEENEEKKE
ncbi:MAG: 50S ribosomal protein L25 [Candidatus Moraniibacteriota bacterium]|nr:MAG: 50S ribosomal protein L25 [Candidatus Moranbacteria bacterium]